MKKFIAAILVIVVMFTVTLPKQTASADALVLSQLAAAAYAMSVGSGLDFTFTAGTAGGAQGYMERRLENWVNSQSGGMSIFGTTPVRAIAAKLAITQTAFNALKNFINDYITENSITNTSVRVYNGQAGGVDRDTWLTNFGATQTGISVEAIAGSYPSGTNSEYNRQWTFNVYYNGTVVGTGTYTQNGFNYVKPTKWRLFTYNGRWTVEESSHYLGYSESTVTNERITLSANLSLSTQNEINAVIPDGMNYPEVGLDDLQTYKRQDWAPDTNLEQMLQDIFEEVADNNLVLTDETIADNPETPVPTDPPVSDIPGQLGGIQEGLNDLIGTQTGIAEGINDITGALEGVQEGVGEITEALEGVGEGIGSISEALEIPTTSQATQLKLPDLRTLFPFCIPFDIYNIISAFNASPVAPRVQIPFNVPAIGLTYTFDLDFSAYNSVAAVLRTVEFVAYAIGLAILSSKVIRW